MKLKGRLAVHPDKVSALAFSPDGSVLVSSGWKDDTLAWIDVKARKVIATTPLGQFEPHALSLLVLSPTELWATRWPHPRARVCHFNRTGEVAELGKSHLSWVYLRGSRDRRVALSGGIKKGLVVWDVGSSKPVGTLVGPKGASDSFALSPDGSRAANLGYTNHLLTCFDVKRGKVLWKDTVAFSGAVVFSPDGDRLLDSSEGLIARDSADGETLWSTEAIQDATELAWAPSGKIVAANTHVLVVLDGADGRLKKTIDLPEHMEVMAHSDDGKTLVIGTDRGELLFF